MFLAYEQAHVWGEEVLSHETLLSPVTLLAD